MINLIKKRLKLFVFILFLTNINTNLFGQLKNKGFTRSQSFHSELHKRGLQQKPNTPTFGGGEKEFFRITPISPSPISPSPISSEKTKFKKVKKDRFVLTVNETGCLRYKENSEKELKAFTKEKTFLNLVKHPNIIEFTGFLKTKEHLCIFIEDGDMSLDDFLSSDNINSFDISTKIKILKDVISGIAHMHSLGYVNRDIKPKNVVLFNTKNQKDEIIAKLIDFTVYEEIPEGNSFILDPDNKCRGTLAYMDPECLRDRTYLEEKIYMDKEIDTENEGIKVTFANDIYSFAVLMYNVLYEKQWNDDNNLQTRIDNQIYDWAKEDYKTEKILDDFDDYFDKVYNKYYQTIFIQIMVEESWRPQLDDSINPNLNELLERCWSDNPDDRPTANEIFEMLQEIEI